MTNETRLDLATLRKKAAYFDFFDYPGSWYARHPSDADISIPYRDVITILDRLETAEATIDEFREWADKGYSLMRQYGPTCDTCRTPMNASGINPASILDRT